MCGSTNKSPTKLNVVENKVDTVICLQMGKPPRQKSHQMNLRSLFPKIHYYHNKRLQVKESQYLIPTYS